MLHALMPLKVDAAGMFRLGLALLHYLPNFTSREVSLNELQTDLPNTWVHARVNDVSVREESPGRFYVYLELLFMTTMLAGRITTFRVSYKQMRGIFKAIGLRNRVKETEVLNPRELMSMYVYVHLTESDKQRVGIEAWTATASEKKKNKELAMLRKKKDCSYMDIECVDCELGKDKCALACRKTSPHIIQPSPDLLKKGGSFDDGTPESKNVGAC